MRLALLRIVLLFAAAAVLAAFISSRGQVGFSLALTPQLSALYFIPVNLFCLWWLRRRLRARGSGLRQLAHYEPGRLGRDALLGLGWLFVMFVPFALGLNLAMLLLFGPSGMLGAYEVVFAPDPSLLVEWPRWFTVASALAAALLFPLTNAPAEELVFRGHAQGELLAAGRPLWLALLLPSLLFGLQHTLLSPSAEGAVVYAAAFFLWGLTAGLIYWRSRRLMPLILAHFYTNAMFSVVPLVLLFVPLQA